MKLRIALITLFLFCCGIAAQAQVGANRLESLQENTTFGPVWRVTLYKVKPGKITEALMDMRQNLRPIEEEYKKQGLTVDYKIYTNSTKEGPEDWDITVAVAYKNWAALDDFGKRSAPVVQKHFGTREKGLAAAEHRRELMEVISSRLMRELMLNPTQPGETSQSTTPKQP